MRTCPLECLSFDSDARWYRRWPNIVWKQYRAFLRKKGKRETERERESGDSAAVSNHHDTKIRLFIYRFAERSNIRAHGHSGKREKATKRKKQNEPNTYRCRFFSLLQHSLSWRFSRPLQQLLPCPEISMSSSESIRGRSQNHYVDRCEFFGEIFYSFKKQIA